MSKIHTIIIGLLGVGCFSAGVYYATLQFDKQVNVWDSNYQIITDKVYAFEKVSDPKTIRLYVNELNKILDDVTFLGKIVESGQVSSESLDEFFTKYQTKIDDVNRRMVELSSEYTEQIDSLHHGVNLLWGGDELLVEEIYDIKDKLKSQKDYVNQLNVEIGQSVKQLEDNVQTIKSSKYGNKIWTVKNDER
jgi:peptidoglycan hydrolase CwlO-like protein